MKFAAEPKTWILGVGLRTMLLNLVTAMVAAVLLGGCASSKHESDPTEGMPVEEIYQDAKEELNSGQYETAVNLYSKLIARYPYGAYAQQALLDTAYAYYRDRDFETSIVTSDRFIKVNPRHKHVDYAYYLRGLAAYSMERSLLDRTFKQDPTERDSYAAKRAYDYFNELVTQFPNSRFSADAYQRMVYLNNALGRYEIHVAEYYLRRQVYLAAANRAKYVLSHFQRTPSAADALVVLVRAYRFMDLPELADDALRVLQLNHPEHPGLKKLIKTNNS